MQCCLACRNIHTETWTIISKNISIENQLQKTFDFHEISISKLLKIKPDFFLVSFFFEKIFQS